MWNAQVRWFTIGMTDRISPLRHSQYLLLLLALTLLWPSIMNGGAFYFPDTSAYIRGVDAAFSRAFGWHSVWSQAAPLPTPGIAAPGPSVPVDMKPVLLGRSPYYGIIPFLSVAFTSSDWPTILVQALCAGLAAIGLTRHFIDPRQQAFGWTCAAGFLVLAMTPLPFFVSMLMPDFMAGIGIIAAAVLIAGWKRERWAWRMIWLLLGVVATLMHSANILIFMLISAATLCYAALRRDGRLACGSAFVVLAALLGLVGEAAFAQTVMRLTGTPPIRPPFVSARLIEDGPGLAYLDRTCPHSNFTLCRFRQRMPQGSDTFLWSPDPGNGVFSAVSPADQRALSNEQGRFTLATITTFPKQSIVSVLRAVGHQVSLLSLIEFNYPQLTDLQRIPQPLMADIVRTRAYAHSMPVPSATSLWSIVLVSLGLVIAAFWLPKTRLVTRYGVMIVLGCCANDIICGALSTPHDRYQTRVIWVLPLVGLLIAIRARYGRSAEADRRGAGAAAVPA